uniref:Uncharacterized protein n=1 Tax=Capsaspora owczarzaki TaxID=192875 RepID=M1JEV4_9EUKA|nr:hypothetical protein [Capsaspora owczarzaki]
MYELMIITFSFLTEWEIIFQYLMKEENIREYIGYILIMVYIIPFTLLKYNEVLDNQSQRPIKQITQIALITTLTIGYIFLSIIDVPVLYKILLTGICNIIILNVLQHFFETSLLKQQPKTQKILILITYNIILYYFTCYVVYLVQQIDIWKLIHNIQGQNIIENISLYFKDETWSLSIIFIIHGLSIHILLITIMVYLSNVLTTIFKYLISQWNNNRQMRAKNKSRY